MQIPSNTFSDVDDNSLTYLATLGNGDPLPSWLTFNGSTQTFSGTPPANFNGQIALKVTASDGSLNVFDTFTLGVTAVNDAPVLVNAIAEQSARSDEVFTFQLPTNTFSDPDGDTLTYMASLDNGNALPSWLSFNTATRTFTGTPPHELSGNINLKVTASDGSLTTSDTFALAITPQNDLLINGTLGADILGGDGGDLIHGFAGNDTISGTGNMNVAFGDEGNDQLYFTGSQNQLYGSEGNDWLGVNGTNNALVGGAGDEVWIGASGNSNTLDGQDGDDALFANGNGNT